VPDAACALSIAGFGRGTALSAALTCRETNDAATATKTIAVIPTTSEFLEFIADLTAVDASGHEKLQLNGSRKKLTAWE
jgi:hypothetical protein